MGRFKQKRIMIKVCEEIDLVFWDWNRIYIRVKNTGKWYLFHKYHAPLGTYTNNWRPFKRRLMKINSPSFVQCCQLAYQYEIVAQGAVGELEFRKKDIEIKYPKWSIKGVAE